MRSGDKEEMDGSSKAFKNCLKRAAAPTLISCAALLQLAFKSRWRCRKGGEERTAEERQTDRQHQQYWFSSPCLLRWLVGGGLIPGTASLPIYLLFHVFAPFLTPRVQEGCFQQPANAFRADNLGILCVWYTYHTAAQLPWCASNIYFKKGKKKENPPQSISSTALAAEASHITFRGELAGCGSVCLFIYFWQRHSHSLWRRGRRHLKK